MADQGKRVSSGIVIRRQGKKRRKTIAPPAPLSPPRSLKDAQDREFAQSLRMDQVKEKDRQVQRLLKEAKGQRIAQEIKEEDDDAKEREFALTAEGRAHIARQRSKMFASKKITSI